MKLTTNVPAGLRSVSRRGGLALLLAVVLLALVPIAMILAAPGDLDLTFDSDGKATTDIDSGVDEANDVLVQPDGKILALVTASAPISLLMLLWSDTTVMAAWIPASGRAVACSTISGSTENTWLLPVRTCKPTTK